MRIHYPAVVLIALVAFAALCAQEPKIAPKPTSQPPQPAQSPVRTPSEEVDRVRVAKAIVEADAARKAKCCGEDLEAAKKASVAKGDPIVVFVGGCSGRGKEVAKLEAISCTATEYSGGDGAAPGKKRIVVLAPDKDKGTFLIWKTLPTEAKMKEILETLNDIRNKAGKPPLKIPNWDI